MADYLPITKISELVITTPGNDEVVSKLTDSDRQIKSFLKSFLAVSFDDAGTIKATAIADLSAGEVDTASIADYAVTHIKIGLQAVEADNIKLGTITAAQIATGSLTAALFVGGTILGENSVTNIMVSKSTTDDALRAISTDTIKTDAVTNAKILTNTIAPVKILHGADATTDPTLIAGCTTGTYASHIRGILTASLDASNDLVFSLASSMGLGDLLYTRFEERYANFSTTGAATGPALDSWYSRGTGAAAWTKVGLGADVTSAGDVITVNTGGTYLVRFLVPFFNFATPPAQCQAVLCQFIAGTPNVYEPTCVGTSEYASIHAKSLYSGVITITAGAKFVMKGWTETATTPPPTNASGQLAIYSVIEFLKL